VIGWKRGVLGFPGETSLLVARVFTWMDKLCLRHADLLNSRRRGFRADSGDQDAWKKRRNLFMRRTVVVKQAAVGLLAYPKVCSKIKFYTSSMNDYNFLLSTVC